MEFKEIMSRFVAVRKAEQEATDKWVFGENIGYIDRDKHEELQEDMKECFDDFKFELDYYLDNPADREDDLITLESIVDKYEEAVEQYAKNFKEMEWDEEDDLQD